MKYAKLGKKNMDISKIIIGGGAIGGILFKYGKENAVEGIRRALNYGINWFDTAEAYGNGKSEEMLGEILKELDARPNISSKVIFRGDEFNDISGTIRRHLEASLKRMNRDSIELYQLHNAITQNRFDSRNSLSVDDVLGTKGAAETLEKLREEGLIRATGFTAFGDPRCSVAMVESGFFDSLQVYFNLLNPSALWDLPADFNTRNFLRIIKTAKENDVSVLNVRVLAAGALAGRVLPVDIPAFFPGMEGQKENARVQSIMEGLKINKEELYKLALRTSFHEPAITAVCVGFSSADEIDAAVAVLDEPPVDDDTIALLKTLYGRSPFTGS